MTGAWRSSEQFDNRPRATVVVRRDGQALSGTLTLLGMTRGADDRATLETPFRDASWDGTRLSFDTTLPGEGTTRWVLHITAEGKATLRPAAEDGKPVDGAPVWEMARP